VPKTFILLKRETSLSLGTSANTPTAFEGFLLKVTVDTVNDITDKIFVMQRDVASNYVDGVLDTFYSIASVAELELLPEDAPEEDGTNFFRTNSIELIFETPEELEEAWKKIRYDVSALSIANDSSLTIDQTIYQPYPADSILKYFGVNENVLPNGTNVKSSLYSSGEFLAETVFSSSITTDSYVYVVLHESFGTDREIEVNGINQPTTITSTTIDSEYGVTLNYNIFRTTNKIVSPLLASIRFS
jgi:hypothetical protein